MNGCVLYYQSKKKNKIDCLNNNMNKKDREDKIIGYCDYCENPIYQDYSDSIKVMFVLVPDPDQCKVLTFHSDCYDRLIISPYPHESNEE
jgi:hypothetical protein